MPREGLNTHLSRAPKVPFQQCRSLRRREARSAGPKRSPPCLVTSDMKGSVNNQR